MTEEEKQLLLIDLCARLPYGVKVRRIKHTTSTDTIESVEIFNFEWLREFYVEGVEFKPYLRPMSSMTTEEEYEYHQCKNIDYIDICEMEHEEILETTALCFSHATDWLNKKGFDYRGLISMGLALEAKEGMYK